jgi:predicted hydrocarbon binding protein
MSKNFVFDVPVQNGFKWNDIGNIKEGRMNLGEEMPVAVYRLFQYTMREVLDEQFGTEKMIELFRSAGDKAGREFARNTLDLKQDFNKFVAQLQKELHYLKIGVLRVESYDEVTGKLILTVEEDLDCSGLPMIGTTVCNYDEGFIAGILKEYTKKQYQVEEIDCWATGSRVCRFAAEIV